MCLSVQYAVQLLLCCCLDVHSKACLLHYPRSDYSLPADAVRVRAMVLKAQPSRTVELLLGCRLTHD